VALALAFALAVHWPVVMVANRYRPAVLGLPFTLVWVSLWIVIALVVLWIIDRGLHGKPGADDTAGR
jgi:hypothetical protein